MKISITIAQGDTETSVIIDDRRRISDVIGELARQGYLPRDCKDFMRSAVQERVISTINTFQEEGIYSGDKITEIE
ncbi:hypothetical protein [Mogibacterium diversum]